MSGSIILLNGEFWDNFRHDCKLVIITWIILFEWTLLKGSWFDFGFGFLCFWATWDFQSFGLLLVVSLRNGSRLIRTWQRDKKCPSSFTPSLSHHHLPFFFPLRSPPLLQKPVFQTADPDREGLCILTGNAGWQLHGCGPVQWRQQRVWGEREIKEVNPYDVYAQRVGRNNTLQTTWIKINFVKKIKRTPCCPYAFLTWAKTAFKKIPIKKKISKMFTIFVLISECSSVFPSRFSLFFFL